MRTSLIYSFMLLVALLLQPASAQVPEVLNYQGTLADAVGRPSTGQFEMTFRLYDALSGGTLLWEEAQRNPVDVDEGNFSVVLGEVQRIGLNFDSPLFLGIEIDGTGELVPRTQLTAVAYSLHALSVAEGALQAGSNVTIVPDQGALVISAAVSGGGVTGLGGINNAATGNASTVAGGEDNTAGGDFSTIAGGRDNEASGRKSFVGGGEGNTASGIGATIVGGTSNTATAIEAFIGSGSTNIATGVCSFIGDGLGNTASTFNGTIGGGWNNTVTDRFATIGGGEGNRAGSDPGNPSRDGTSLGSHATVGGGHLNTASGVSTTVGGGAENLASGPGATVGGGGENTASGSNGTIPGGTNNVAGGVASFAAGTRADALHDGSFVWADRLTGIALVTKPRFASTAPNQFLIRAEGGVGIGTNNPQTRLHVNGDTRVDGQIEAEQIRLPIGVVPGHVLTTDANGVGTWQPAGGSALNLQNQNGDIIFDADVGIGTGSPQSELDVDGTIRMTRFQMPEGADQGLVMTADDDGVGTWQEAAAIKDGDDISIRAGVGDVAIESLVGGVSIDGAVGGISIGGGAGGVSIESGADLTMDSQTVNIQSLTTNLTGNVNLPFTTNYSGTNLQAFVSGIAANTVSPPSDIRLKKDVEVLSQTLAAIDTIRGVRYRWQDPERPQEAEIGVIAQEVEQVFPELVREGADGYKRVAYGQLSGVLIEAVKELHGIVREKDAELQSTKAQIVDLKSEMDELRNLVHSLAATSHRPLNELDSE